WHAPSAVTVPMTSHTLEPLCRNRKLNEPCSHGLLGAAPQEQLQVVVCARGFWRSACGPVEPGGHDAIPGSTTTTAVQHGSTASAQPHSGFASSRTAPSRPSTRSRRDQSKHAAPIKGVPAHAHATIRRRTVWRYAKQRRPAALTTRHADREYHLRPWRHPR